MPKFSFLLFGFLALSSFVLADGRNIFEDVGNAAKGFVDSVCATLYGTISGIGTCQADFVSTLSTPQTQIFDSDNQVNKDFEQIRGNIKSCCAIAAFQSCVYDYIKEKCGDQAESHSRALVHNVVGKGDDYCTGTEWYYQKESPLCWPEPVQYIAVIVLAIIFILSCCCCFCRICRK